MMEQVRELSQRCLNSQISFNFLKINQPHYCDLGFNRACLMGKPKVIEFLLEHAGDSLDEMMRMYDGTGMTGFMHACQWNKVEVVELLIDSSIGKSDVHEGFLLACQNKREKIIAIIFQNDKFRKHILIKEEDKGNVIRKQYGNTELRQQIQWLSQNQEMVISFDERNHQLDIETKVNSTLPASHHQPAEPARYSLTELESMKVVKKASEGLNLAHLCHGRTPE